MNIELTKEQQLQLIKANKFFKLKMLNNLKCLKIA